MEIKNLAKAVVSTAQEIKGVDKSMQVGEGRNSYKAVSDKDVKQIVGRAMQNNGLSILPTGVDVSTQLDTWDEEGYKPGMVKKKMHVFVEAKCTYLLMHTSGESIEIVGYGHGVDSQDKAAGKATTYALKYALLYSFLVPTGDIDDTDTQHSNSATPVKQEPKKATRKSKPKLTVGDDNWAKVKTHAENNKDNGFDHLITQYKTKYSISKETEKAIKDLI